MQIDCTSRPLVATSTQTNPFWHDSEHVFVQIFPSRVSVQSPESHWVCVAQGFPNSPWRVTSSEVVSIVSAGYETSTSFSSEASNVSTVESVIFATVEGASEHAIIIANNTKRESVFLMVLL
jgi:hypothetical protein